MKLEPFVLENWLNPAANSPKTEVYLGGSCVLPLTVEELFDVTGQDLDSFIEEFKEHLDLEKPFQSYIIQLNQKTLS
mgnify:CR=1 FL=1